jgi:hypothetical protein
MMLKAKEVRRKMLQNNGLVGIVIAAAMSEILKH